jgi:hypothetical protein
LANTIFGKYIFLLPGKNNQSATLFNLKHDCAKLATIKLATKEVNIYRVTRIAFDGDVLVITIIFFNLFCVYLI